MIVVDDRCFMKSRWVRSLGHAAGPLRGPVWMISPHQRWKFSFLERCGFVDERGKVEDTYTDQF